MTLKKKILAGFFLSSGIIATLMVSGHFTYLKIRNEVMFLETTDTIRTKSLQIRRHEKNFFLYREMKEAENVHRYVGELKAVLEEARSFDSRRLIDLEDEVDGYSLKFDKIEAQVRGFQREVSRMKEADPRYAALYPFIEASSLENPKTYADLLGQLSPTGSGRAIRILRDLDHEIIGLREVGEKIIETSKDLDLAARKEIDGLLFRVQVVNIVFFFVFFIAGIGIFMYIINDVIKRLKSLTGLVEKAGEEGPSESMAGRGRTNDEVDVLTRKFLKMEEQLISREREILEAKKLSAVGTLASGVAHELNNPLNNIYTTAQRLQKKAGDECPPFIKKGLDDIFDQTMRVKRIVGDLLEFTREREPDFQQVELGDVIQRAYKQTTYGRAADEIRFLPSLEPPRIEIQADPELLERLFINLFGNAVDAMPSGGELRVKAFLKDGSVTIGVSDTGAGIPEDVVEKVFEPFFSTKAKGTGLGLAIVYNIVRKHHGEIRVKNEAGKGALFIIRLPVNRHG